MPKRRGRLAGLAPFVGWVLLFGAVPRGEGAPTDNSGAARFRIPIEVPPGPGGFAPELALVYSSQAGDGPFGVGWRLSGLGEVRCSIRFGVPEYEDCPQYELDGHLLVYDGSQSYHTSVESFARIIRVSDSWEVTLPNGTLLRYGLSTNSRVAAGPSTARWLLAETQDPFGNQIFITYEEETGSRYPSRITYGPGATAASGKRQIEFAYEPRPDPIHDFAGGIERQITQRLIAIRVLSYQALFQRHDFGYDLAGGGYSTARSRLAWTQLFGNDCQTGPCTALPKQEFEYTDPDSPYYDSEEADHENQLLGGEATQWVENAAYQFPGTFIGTVGGNLPQNSFADINGDGLVDLVWPANLRINTGDGFAEDPAWQAAFAAIQAYEFPKMELTQVQPNDPAAPFWAYSGVCGATLTEELHGTSQASAGFLGPDATFVEGDAQTPDSVMVRGRVLPADLNADGFADLVVSVRLSGVYINLDCQTGEPLEEPWQYVEGRTVSIVFRNTGDPATGFVRDDDLARGLPAFGEIAFESGYFMDWQYPEDFSLEGRDGPCALRGLRGHNVGTPEKVCYNRLNFAPRFVDLNGDGFLDLMVLARASETGAQADRALWLGDWVTYVDHSTQNTGLRTRAWVQNPDAGPGDRWVRDERFDLPDRSFGGGSNGVPYAHVMVWSADQPLNLSPTTADYPATFSRDPGLRFADLNRDGLTDVIWKLDNPDGHVVLDEGVLLNTGGGSPGSSASAWCGYDGLPGYEGGNCPWAADHLPPGYGFAYWSSRTNVSTGHLGDLNGDGLLDFLYLDYVLGYEFQELGVESWLRSPGDPTGWRQDDRFRAFPEDDMCEVAQLAGCSGDPLYYASFLVIDANGDGVSDVIGTTDARVSQFHHGDVLRELNNGRGGVVQVAYDSAVRLRDLAPNGLEEVAITDASAQGEVIGADNIVRWTTAPVVAEWTVNGPNLGGAGGADPAPTTYRYAHPQFSRAIRSPLGFRLIERTRPDEAVLEHYFYQHLGRAGRTSRIELFDAASLVHRYEEDWNLLAGASVPGSLDDPDVHVGRLAETRATTWYGVNPGPTITRTLSYDDEYGYNFVNQIVEERPTGVLRSERIPDSQSSVLGLVADETLYDAPTGGTLLRHTAFTYTGGKVASRTETVEPRGDPGAGTDETTSFAYDTVYGNVIQRTEELTSGNRVTNFCYDGDGGWCPSSEVAPGQDSHSVLVAIQDPPLQEMTEGMITTFEPDPRSGRTIAVDSAYTDVPDRRLVLDGLSRVVSEYVTPEGGSEALAVATIYHDDVAPPYVERLSYTDETATDSHPTLEVSDGFGGVWKRIEEVEGSPPTYFGTLVYRNPEDRTVRETLPLDCGVDPICSSFSGQAEPFARKVISDPLGRPVSVETPDGTSTAQYGVASGGMGGTLHDHVEVQNAKGDLLRKGLDGDRVAWVDECHDEDCDPFDRTTYTYEATGEISTIYDPTGSWSDPNHYLRYHYDTLGRVIQIDDPDLTGTGSSLTSYDELGNVVSVVNARGEIRSYTYDELDRLTAITTPEDEPDHTVTYRDTELQPWVEESQLEGSPQVRLTYTYDGFGRKQRVSTWVPGILAEQLVDYKYDLLDRPTRITYPDTGTVVRYEYEGAYLKRVCDLEGEASCAGTGAIGYVTDADYDEYGRRQYTWYGGGARTFTYDGARDRLTQDRFIGAGFAYWYQRDYVEYDEVGNLKVVEGVTAPDDDVVIGESYTYDRRNRLASWTKDGATVDYGYDELGNLTLHANEQQAFGDENRPHAITERAGVAYTYDEDGNVTSMVGGGIARYFQYDSANQMVCEGTSQGSCDIRSLRYDLHGSRVSEWESVNVHRVYVEGGLYVWERQSATGSAATAEIRAFGGVIAFKRIGGPQTRTAGIHTLLLAPETFGGLGVLAALALLVWAARNGVWILVLRRPATAGAALVMIVTLVVPPVSWSGGGGDPVLRWQLADPLGSGLVLLNEEGTRERHLQFTPFGGEYSRVGPDKRIAHYYAGHAGITYPNLHPNDLGLHYMGARWYDPGSGAFLSIDPVVGNAFDPQSVNAYAYARNNPVRFKDPTGMCGLAVMGDGGWCPSTALNQSLQEEIDREKAATGYGPRGDSESAPPPPPAALPFAYQLASGYSSGPIAGAGEGRRQSQGGILLAQGGDDYLISFYQGEVDRLTERRNELEALAEAEEAQVAKIDQEIDEIELYLDPYADRTARQELARNVGIVSRGAEFLRDQEARRGELGKERTEHERRARGFRREVAAIDRTIGSYRSAIEALGRRAN